MWHSVMVGQGPMCSLLADFTGCQSASLGSVYSQKLELVPRTCSSAGWRGGSCVTTRGDGHCPWLPGQIEHCSSTLSPVPEAGHSHLNAASRDMQVCWVLRKVAGIHNLKNYSLLSWPFESAQTSQSSCFQGRQKVDPVRCLQ